MQHLSLSFLDSLQRGCSQPKLGFNPNHALAVLVQDRSRTLRTPPKLNPKPAPTAYQCSEHQGLHVLQKAEPWFHVTIFVHEVFILGLLWLRPLLLVASGVPRICAEPQLLNLY